jgi:methyl-accepting chemotaxis protein
MLDFFNHFYWNYYSISYFINAVFSTSLFIALLGMKSRDEASKTALLTFAAYTAVMGAFTISHAMYLPSMAFHRWVTFPISLVVTLIGAKLILSLPTTETPKVSKYFLLITVGYSALAVLYFLSQTFNEKIIFNPSSENWDFDADQLSEKLAILILINAIALYGIGIFKIFTTKEKKSTLVLLLLAFVFISIYPAYLNVQTRAGLLERNLFSVAFSTSAIVGTFMLLIAYLNGTKDPTSFMTKLISICMALLMLILEFISFDFLKDEGKQFDELSAKEALLDWKGIPSKNIKYRIRYDLASNSFTGNESTGLDLHSELIEFRNTFLLEKLLSTSQDSGKLIVALRNLNVENYPHFETHRNLLLAELEQIKTEADFNLDESVSKMNQFTSYHKKRISKLSEATFRSEMEKYISKQNQAFLPLESVLKKSLLNQSLSDKSLKSEILDHLTPAFLQGHRRLRKADNLSHFVSYVFTDLENQVVYEYGYDYLYYRTFLHKSSKPIAWLTVITLSIVVFGFRLFFFTSLVKPLESLLDGVKRVNKGDLSVVVTPGVEDEIGFLSKSFNSMVLSIKEAQFNLQEYAAQLEEKVAARTQDLMESLEKVQVLKNQQDGDYFLTSLLIKPLNTNKVESDNVSVEFLTHQKKKFTFKEWTEEIGGDLCMANTIFLKGKKYTLYINADAMGKSLQGAGGALVLGSVFESIVNRNHVSESNQNLFPETWIKNAFLELHKVFETFDGSMLVSMVVGLVDDETGLMYSINVEHPWSILFRDGKASFIDTEKTYRKLGTLGAEGNIKIFTHQLFPDDQIIAGSDGRDDVILSIDNGENVMNENEQLILSHVEKAKGNLDQIFKLIKDTGTLIDDVTLIKITYKKHTATASDLLEDQKIAEVKKLMALSQNREAINLLENLVDENPTFVRARKILFRILLQNNNYTKALSHVENLISVYPGDTELLFQCSYTEKKIGNYKRACELGEIVKLRNPGHVKNLINLADAYLLDRNQNRSLYLIDIVLRIDPENAQARKRQEILHKGSN